MRGWGGECHKHGPHPDVTQISAQSHCLRKASLTTQSSLVPYSALFFLALPTLYFILICLLHYCLTLTLEYKDRTLDVFIHLYIPSNQNRA